MQDEIHDGPRRHTLDRLLEHRAWVRGLVRSIVLDRSIADDVEQQVWLSALSSAPPRIDQPRAWLATVARNWARRIHRGASRRTHREAAVATPEAAPAAADPVERAEAHRSVVEAVLRLPEPLRASVLLHHFDGLSVRDVAERLAVPHETVRSRLRLARARLRTDLRDSAADGAAAWSPALLALGGLPQPARTEEPTASPSQMSSPTRSGRVANGTGDSFAGRTEAGAREIVPATRVPGEVGYHPLPGALRLVAGRGPCSGRPGETLMRWACAWAAVLVLGAAFTFPARADEPRSGPGFGNNKYAATIATVGGEKDTDDYVSPLVAGERLSVTVTAVKKTTLRPVISLVSPAGVAITAPALAVRRKAGGKTVVLSNFAIRESGQWTVRIAGGASVGPYTVTFRVSGLQPVRLSNVLLTAGTNRVAEFQGVSGAKADLVLKWARNQSAAAFRSLTTPEDTEVPGRSGPAYLDAKPRGATSLLLRGVALPGPDGTYKVAVGTDGATARISLDVTVRPPVRPSRRRIVKLADEPRLDPRTQPVRSVGGARAVFTGRYFATKGVPTVTIGGVPATDVKVGRDGTSVDVLVPAGVDDSTVPVSVRNPDGQTSTRADYLYYAPAPRVADLVRDDHSRARGGSSAGLQTFHLTGANLATSGQVRFGGVTATILSGGGNEILVRSPPHAEGNAAVVYTDEFGRSAGVPFFFVYKHPPVIDSLTPPYGTPAGGITVTVAGTGFQADDVVTLDGASRAVVRLGGSAFTFISPAGSTGVLPLRIKDRVGTVAAYDFEIKGPPTITSAAVVAGPVLGTRGVPFAGGTTLRVAGTYLRAGDDVTLGGAVVVVTARTSAGFDLIVPSSTTPGDATLVVTDPFGQSASLAAAVRYVGFLDASAARTPAPSSTDSLAAWTGASGDLDGDSAADDLVVAAAAGASPGSRAELTRLLRGDGSKLADQTASGIPAALSDPAGADPWDANALAIGDLDQGSGRDVVVAGAPRVAGAYYSYDARLFVNDGSGAFSFDAENSPLVAGASSYGFDAATGNSYPFITITPTYLALGDAQCVAIGDLDGDGDDDVVMGGERYRAAYIHIAPAYVDFTTKTGSDTYALYSGWSTTYSQGGTYYYLSATRVFENDTKNGNRFRDRSFVSMPHGSGFVSTYPALAARDLALGDLDGDGSLDLVLTWDEPTTTTAYGQYYGAGYDVPRISTEVLLNDGYANFSDATTSWMPAGSGNEWWQGSRCVLANLDPQTDGDLDLVIVHSASIDAYTGTPTFAKRALRILRNDGSQKGFVDVTGSSLPSIPLSGTSDDNLRGEALAVTDLDGDGWPDILVGTTEALTAPGGTRVRGTRLLLGGAGMKFTDATAFLPPAATDTGEARSLHVFDVAGRSSPTLFLVSPVLPGASTGSRTLRCFEWHR